MLFRIFGDPQWGVGEIKRKKAMRLLQYSILVISAFVISLPNVSAAKTPGSAGKLFSLGAAAFAQAKYEQALRYFKAADEAGMETAALQYNLGVTYYKLKRYGDARNEFEKLTADAETASLAHYNLGRVALAMEDKSTAEHHFQTAYRTAKDPKLRRLADQQLQALAPELEASRWTGYASLAAGYDDNVTLDADSETLVGKIEDEFLEAIGAVSGQVLGTRDNGLQIKSTGYYQDYLDADEFDFGNLRIGPELDRKFGEWNTSLAGYLDLAYIDKELFEKVFSAEVEGSRPISRNLELQLDYSLGIIDAESPYEDLTGSRHRLGVDLRSVIFDTYTGLGYTLEINDRDDEDFPTRHSVHVLAQKDLTEKWGIGVDGSYRYSDYGQTDREDERLWLSARISRSIAWDFQVYAKYDHIRNDSNIDENEYTSNLFFLGIERFF